ncbi:MAG: acetyl-CoA carboxylase carboxyltransferase subunit alpha [Wenzhouxiangella sp.]|jgi:acetyl-CoA carboxylase carboxyl transferase subunit alpha|nr:acetyl-CoA carboxylase carboxyltransferase subunit alpha [Wenzhouxiangella sp.]MDR9452780.1 acetyl-CoA carboxylase carboxyltransferase subunit alpha [Wenzhouxiangella sp.]
MPANYLDFEQPIAELEAKIEELRGLTPESDFNLDDEIAKLESKCQEQTQRIFSALTDWQITQLARHPQRPYTFDYLPKLFDEVQLLHGDRQYADDKAIVGGLAKLGEQSVMVIGHQKGRSTKDKVFHNFGMPRPEGYRKAMRLMQMAERFKLPIVTFIDTPGAYPGVGAEERGQSEAIARNLAVMSRLSVPIICTVIGEGGSGGALAIGVGDRVNMLEYSIYSVISPEGCASILWKDAARAKDAAGAMGLTATRLEQLGLIDKVIKEPLGGAHRDLDAVALKLRETLEAQLKALHKMTDDERLKTRFDRLMSHGSIQTQ